MINWSLPGSVQEVATGVRKKTVKDTAKYDRNLARYNETIHRGNNCDYLNIVQPFQLVVESSPSDFQGGLAEGMRNAAEKMANGVSNFLRAQVMDKDYPLDSFQSVDNKLAYGMTVYILTDADMQELERRLKESQNTPKNGV